MAEETVPPLKRAALAQLPAVQQALLEYWQALATLAADVSTGCVHIHPDQVPASALQEWVAWHSHLLSTVLQATGNLDLRLWDLLEIPMPEAFTTALAERLEDAAAPTD